MNIHRTLFLCHKYDYERIWAGRIEGDSCKSDLPSCLYWSTWTSSKNALREYVMVKLNPKLPSAQPPLDRSQPLFYFVLQEILTVKLARLASSMLQVLVFGLWYNQTKVSLYLCNLRDHKKEAIPYVPAKCWDSSAIRFGQMTSNSHVERIHDTHDSWLERILT